jgi:hypothetical protein
VAAPRFTTEISLGHIAIVASLLGPVVVFYADVSSKLSNHEHRIAQTEDALKVGRVERLAFQDEMRRLVLTIKEDIATIKATIKSVGDK